MESIPYLEVHRPDPAIIQDSLDLFAVKIGQADSLGEPKVYTFFHTLKHGQHDQDTTSSHWLSLLLLVTPIVYL